MVNKTRAPAHIMEHLEKVGRKHQYVSYAQGAKYYDLPYWTFVHLAKDAGATVNLHKTAIADIFAVDRYLDEYCLVEAEKTSKKESEREIMKRKSDMEKIKKQVASGSKRWVRYNEGAELYSVGLHTFEKMAKDAKAVYKVGNIILVDTQKLDQFIMAFELEEEDY